MRQEPGDLLQGTLGILILKSLMLGRAHGYAVARWIEDGQLASKPLNRIGDYDNTTTVDRKHEPMPCVLEENEKNECHRAAGKPCNLRAKATIVCERRNLGCRRAAEFEGGATLATGQAPYDRVGKTGPARCRHATR